MSGCHVGGICPLSKAAPDHPGNGPTGAAPPRIPQILPAGKGLVAGESLLREIAMALAEFDDFGDAEYEEGLGVLLSSLDEEAAPTTKRRPRRSKKGASMLKQLPGWPHHSAISAAIMLFSAACAC